MRDRVESGILISQENLGTELSKPRYWVNPRRSTQSDLWTPSKLAEFRASKNPEEEANRSSQDVRETTKKVAKLDLVESVEATEPGYVNFRANLARLTELTLKSVRQYG